MTLGEHRGLLAITYALTLCKGPRTQKPGIMNESKKSNNYTTIVIIITKVKENKSLQMGKWWRGARRSSGLIFRAQDWWGCRWYSGSYYYLTDVVEVDFIIRMSWQCLDSEEWVDYALILKPGVAVMVSVWRDYPSDMVISVFHKKLSTNKINDYPSDKVTNQVVVDIRGGFFSGARQ